MNQEHTLSSQRLTAATFSAKDNTRAAKEYIVYLLNGRVVDVNGLTEGKEWQAITDAMGEEIWGHAVTDFNARRSERVEVLFRVHRDGRISRVLSLGPCVVTVEKVTAQHDAVTRMAMRLGHLPPTDRARMKEG